MLNPFMSAMPKFRNRDSLHIELARQRASQMLHYLREVKSSDPTIEDSAVAAMSLFNLELILVCFEELHEMCIESGSLEFQTQKHLINTKVH